MANDPKCTTCGLPTSDPNHDFSRGPPGCPGPEAIAVINPPEVPDHADDERRAAQGE